MTFINCDGGFCYLDLINSRLFLIAVGSAAFILLALAVKLFRRYAYQGEISQLTAEQIEDRRREQEKLEHEKRLRSAILAEARYLAKEIPEQLAIQNKMVRNYDHGLKPRSKKKPVKRIRFECILITRSDIWFRFDGRRLPFGTGFSDLVDKNNKVIENLQYAIGRPCRFFEDYKYNLFLRVGLHSSLMGIPKTVDWSEVVSKIPKSRRYAVAVGVNENSKLVYQDISNWPHGLIMGGTGSGKSSWLKQALITLMQRNTTDQLNICLVDLKRVDLAAFADLPHVIRHVDRPEDMIPLLDWLNEQMNKRLDLFTGVCYDIIGWNRQNTNRRLSRIFLVIDELATITTDRNLKKDAIQGIINLARLGRAAGIHLVLSTQTVSRHVLPMDVLANIEGRICFDVQNTSASTLAIGNGMAVGLGTEGRCIFVSGSNFITAQAPFMTDGEIAIKLAELRGDPDPGPVPNGDIDPKDLFSLILYNLGGRAGVRDVYEAAGGQWGRLKVVNALRDLEYDPDMPGEKVIDIDDGRYILAPPMATNRPRRLLQINGHAPKTHEEIKAMVNGIDNM